MERWAAAYTHGTLIDFDFTQPLALRRQVQQICQDKGWEFSELPGDLALLQKLLDGEWTEEAFLVIRPGQTVSASFDGRVIAAGSVGPESHA